MQTNILTPRWANKRRRSEAAASGGLEKTSGAGHAICCTARNYGKQFLENTLYQNTLLDSYFSRIYSQMKSFA